jgi:hypothetical protein
LKRVKPIEQPAFAIPNAIGISLSHAEQHHPFGLLLMVLKFAEQSSRHTMTVKNTSCPSEHTQWPLHAALATSFDATLDHLTTFATPAIVGITATQVARHKSSWPHTVISVSNPSWPLD